MCTSVPTVTFFKLTVTFISPGRFGSSNLSVQRRRSFGTSSRYSPPNGFTAKMHQIDARVGGTYKMSFTNFTSGKSHSFGGSYLELVPHERIRWTDRFDDPALAGEMTVTVGLKKVSVGTEVNIVQAGIPDAIPAEACVLGWQESLALLAKLVEAEIPD